MQKGLSRKKADKLLREHGLNVLSATNPNPWWKMLLAQFTDLLVIILIVSAAIAVGMGFHDDDGEGLIDGIIILCIVLLNAGIGFFQEYKGEKALEALKKLISPQAVVIRDGERHLVKAEEIVPGDIVVLNAGDKIVADGTILESSELKADEASLTGESVPVYKALKAEVFMGTTIIAGSGLMEVTATGMKTQFGRIAHLTTTTVQDKSPLQKEMHHIGVFVTKVTLFLSAILIVLGIFVQKKAYLEALLFAVSVAVAAVPEGLPATITVALALGVQRMVKRNVVVKRLSAIETLGSTTVICSDKTGTLTKNQMTVVRLLLGSDQELNVSGAGYDPQDGEIETRKQGLPAVEGSEEIKNLEKLRVISAYCTESELQKKDNQYMVLGDPTEGALLTLAHKRLRGQKALPGIPDIKIIGKIPFDSVRKLMSVLVEEKDWKELWTKGSPDEILERSTHILIGGKKHKLDASTKKEIKTANDNMANEALRVIAFAYRDMTASDLEKANQELEYGLTYVGLAGMIDPPRAEVAQAVASCQSAGIRIIVITGDHGLTAKAIARQIGIADEETPVILGKELDEMSEAELDVLLSFRPERSIAERFLSFRPERSVAERFLSFRPERSVAERSGEIPSLNIPDKARKGFLDFARNDKKTLGMTKGSLIFSRVSPEHKLRIVDRLKLMGEIVAVTGDGVNDAPALKRADLGIAMGIAGTEVSKETANMILLDDSFASIVKAVEEGRKIYANLKKFTWFIFSTNIGELFVVFTAIALQLPAPLTAVLILFINVGTDILPAIALGVDHPEPNIMEQKPRNPKTRIMNRDFVWHFLWIGLLIGAMVIASFVWKLMSLGWQFGEILPDGDHVLLRASTLAFVNLVMLQLFNAFNARSFEHSVFSLRTLWHLRGACAISILMVVAMVYLPFLQKIFHVAPLSATDWLVIVGCGVAIVLVEEARKVMRREN